MIRHIVLSIIVFTMVIVGGVSLITNFAEDNTEFIDNNEFPGFNRTFNRMADLQISVDKLEAATQTPPEQGLWGFLDGLMRTTVNALKSIFTTFDFIGEIFVGLSIIFPIPVWVGALLTSMITIIIAFGIFTIVTQREI